MDQRNNRDQQPPRRMKPPENQVAAQLHQPPPPQKCPRCDSPNTKFCYYNNYSLSQPRHFCKACRRYWTHGGTLRNVPVGGGCRKTKRPRPSSSTNEIARTQSLITGMVSGQVLRGTLASPPVGPSIGNSSFYTAAGSFMSPLTGINQGAAVNFNGGVNGQFGANMALLQGINFPSVRPHDQQFQAQNDYFFRSQQNLVPERPPALNSWTQSFMINRSTATTFWGGATACNAADGENQTGSTSFNPNIQWPDNNPGFGPSQ